MRYAAGVRRRPNVVPGSPGPGRPRPSRPGPRTPSRPRRPSRKPRRRPGAPRPRRPGVPGPRPRPPGPPARPLVPTPPASPPGPFTPPARPPIAPPAGPVIRQIQRHAGRVLWWFDLVDYALNSFPPSGQGQAPGWAGYTLRVDCAWPGPPYPQSGPTTFHGTEDLAPWPCLTGQSIAGFAQTPGPFNQTIIEWWGPTTTMVQRYATRQIWTRPTSEPDPIEVPGRDPYFAPIPGTWPNDLPLPNPYWVPGGHIAPVPRPTPWGNIPHRPIVGIPTPGHEGDQGGNDLPGTGPAAPTVPAVVFPPNPGPRPQPQPLPRPRGPNVRERKVRFNSRAAGALWGLIGQVTEAFDFVGALYNSLPAAVRAQARRDARRIHPWAPYVRPDDKVRALYDHYGEIDVAEAIRQLIREEVTDRVYAATPRYENLGWTSPIGIETGSRDEDIREAIEELNGGPLDSAGDVFDWLYPPGDRP